MNKRSVKIKAVHNEVFIFDLKGMAILDMKKSEMQALIKPGNLPQITSKSNKYIYKLQMFVQWIIESNEGQPFSGWVTT